VKSKKRKALKKRENSLISVFEKGEGKSRTEKGDDSSKKSESVQIYALENLLD